jgi:biopolymer transport protein ExbD
MARRQADVEVEAEEPEINMTPMLDIVFIMLIFFIVTTTFIRETGIDPLRPEAQSAEEIRANILIGVDSNGDIHMQQERIELSGVRPLVEEALAQNPEGGVIVIADERASTGRVIEVMDEARRAGAERISIASEGRGGML